MMAPDASIAGGGLTEDGTLRCVIVGATTLPTECAQILREAGHLVRAVATDDPETKRSAEKAGVSAIIEVAALTDLLAGGTVDYLFSINNLALLTDEVLARPARGTINFHDGPLPRWAGRNAPSWGIARGAQDWAVTWHLVTSGIDEGATLLEEPVEISAEETSLSLNMKCFEAGIRSFPGLVRSLSGNMLAPREQDRSKRTYFGRHARPLAACCLLWSRPADELSRLVRALDFGSYRNPIGTAKLLLDEGALAVTALETLGDRTGAPPGTVVSVGAESITVTSVTDDVRISGLRTVDGRPLKTGELAACYGLHEGRKLTEPSGAELGQLTALGQSTARDEEFWAARLAGPPKLELPGTALLALGTDGAATSQALGRVTQAIPASIITALEDVVVGRVAGDAIVACLVVFLARISSQAEVAVRYSDSDAHLSPFASLLSPTVPLRCKLDGDKPVKAAIGDVLVELDAVRARGPYLRDLMMRVPAAGSPPGARQVEIQQVRSAAIAPRTDSTLTITVDAAGQVQWCYDRNLLGDEEAVSLSRRFAVFLGRLVGNPGDALSSLSVLTDDELHHLLVECNSTARPFPDEFCVHDLIQQHASITPDRVALVCEGYELTYGELCERATRLAGRLRQLGVEPGCRVGVCLERSADLVVWMLAILKAGGAYVPLDPTYPAERLQFMVEDAQPAAVLCQRATKALIESIGSLIIMVDDPGLTPGSGEGLLSPSATPGDPAYVIYTSGSTGRPKGVMVSHRNVVNFIYGMDECVDRADPSTFLAVTSISFDISVLELFWTLARGFRVVLYTGAERARDGPSTAASVNSLEFSLFFFASGEGHNARDRYRLLTEAVRFADANEFSAIWTPERHFHAFGGLFPNPSVTSAALAAMTKHVQLRAGSVVSPLHNPIRIAEEWSFVDNLSNGRVGISFASGWQPDDFVLAPERFANRKQIMFEQIEIIQRLWRGEPVAVPGPLGEDRPIQILPRPVQPHLPVWITAAGSPETFRMAGERGYGVLTHLLGQSVEELAEKIAIYRAALTDGGAALDKGSVVLMLHTFVGPEDSIVRELVRAPMKAYLRSSVDLIKRAAWTFPAFKQQTIDEDGEFSLDRLDDDELDQVLDFSFERYFETSGLLGTPEKCSKLLEQLRSVGVNEVACLIDFHHDTEAVLDHLPHLLQVKDQFAARRQQSPPDSIPGLIARYGVTHMQCTPSMAAMLVETDEGRRALCSLRQLLVGGEAFPQKLAAELAALIAGGVLNMYGPTETTIWSSSHRVLGEGGLVPIGRPIANTQFYILDKARQLVAPGTPGELFIGGDGVTLGYLNRPELTAERFVRDPYSGKLGARLYRTGDRVRLREDGNFEFLGRYDDQVKLRGHRSEVGEIEAALARHGEVGETVVVAVGDGPHIRLTAYVTSRNGAVLSSESLRHHLARTLPDFMMPATFEVVPALPRTPNGKIDRKRLPAPGSNPAGSSSGRSPPRDDLERALVDLWEAELGVSPIGIAEDFFKLGGHSLLAVRVFAQLKRRFSVDLPLATFLRAPTVEQLAHAIRRNAGDPEKNWKSLVPITTRGSKPPMFCVHAHGGHVLFYTDLARRLSPERPFYALQARGVDGVLEPLTSFEEMAATYVREIREVQAHGPYRLGGDCLGGVVALEIAHQLRGQGEAVALVVMFDSFHPRYRPYLPRPMYELLHRTRLLFGFNLKHVRRLPGPERAVYVRAKLERAAYMARYRLWDWHRHVTGGQARSDDPLIRTQAALELAFDAHEPKRYDGRVVLFRSAHQPVGIRKDPTLGWNGALSDLDIRLMPSYFTTCIYEPLVGTLAEELRRDLDAIDQSAEQSLSEAGQALPALSA